MTEAKNEDRKHYYLVSGNVVINVEDNITAILQNALIITDDQNLGAHQIGKAQQALQVTLWKKMGQDVNVVDVNILNMIHLGFMTEARFHERPEGLQAVERERPSNVVDITAELKDRG